MQSKHCNHI